MMNDMIHPITTFSARDWLKEVLQDDEHVYQTPTIDGAIEWAEQIRKEIGWYVTPDCLLGVWSEIMKGEK